MTALLLALLVSACDVACYENNDPLIEVTAPDGEHVARLATADCSGFRVDSVFQVSIAPASDRVSRRSVVFRSISEPPRIGWTDAGHLQIVLTSAEVPDLSLHDAQGVSIDYRLDPSLTDQRIRSEYIEQFNPGSDGEAASRAWYEREHQRFVAWAETYAGFRPSSDRPLWPSEPAR